MPDVQTVCDRSADIGKPTTPFLCIGHSFFVLELVAGSFLSEHSRSANIEQCHFNLQSVSGLIVSIFRGLSVNV